MIGVHVQVHVDEVAALPGACAPPACPRRDAGGRRPPVEVLELVRRAPPLQLRVRAAIARGSAPASAASRQQALQLGGQGHRVAGLEQQAQLALVEHLLVLGSRDATGTAPPASARSTSWGAGAAPAEAATAMLARARCWASEPSAGPAKRTRSRNRRGAAAARGRPGRAATRWRSSRAPWAACAARAGTAAARPAPPRRRTRSPVALAARPGAPAGRRRDGSPGRRRGRSARRAHGVAANAPSARRAGRTGAPPAGGATWVDTKRSVGEWNVPMFSAREWRSAAPGARGERLVHVDEVELARSSRSSSVRDTSRGRDTEPPRRKGRLWPTPSTLAHPRLEWRLWSERFPIRARPSVSARGTPTAPRPPRDGRAGTARRRAAPRRRSPRDAAPTDTVSPGRCDRAPPARSGGYVSARSGTSPS